MFQNHVDRSDRVKSSRIDFQNKLMTQVTSDPHEIIEIINNKEKENYKLGILLIIVAVGAWIIGLELVNAVLKGDEYRKPFMFSFITGSCFTLNFLPEIVNFFRKKLNNPLPANKTEDEDSFEFSEQLTRKEVLILAAQISFIYNLYNISVMLSLQYTSASNQTVLGTVSSIFTLFIGIYLRIDIFSFSFKKLVCIMVSITGVFLINYSDGKRDKNSESRFQPKNPLLGNCLALAGAFLYAAYLLWMKAKCGMGKRSTNERQLFGFVGLFSMMYSIPLLCLVHYLKLETFEFPPPSRDILVAILINGIFSVISDYSAIIAMLLTSPLVTTLSLTSAIPITIFIDYILMAFSEDGKPNTSSIYYLGIASIITSVILININITSESELIEEVIDSVLEELIRDDELLSPILSPLLVRSPTSISFNSPYFQPKKIGKQLHNLTLSPNSKLIPKQLPLNESGFNLNQTSQTSEEAPLYNRNHPSELYTLNEPIHQEADSDNTKLIVFSKAKHQYHITTLDSSRTN